MRRRRKAFRKRRYEFFTRDVFPALCTKKETQFKKKRVHRIVWYVQGLWWDYRKFLKRLNSRRG